ncbi:DUF4397 domain-containing protein [Clostridium sp. KNHs214]|uniref:DUF4397 domain-containing protein n=1 Tax=Clostridium sp. KNHs214 TaxID=1540257 RepID=UPI0005583C63|nr:DUF4397 domain-containing protein [Clostridium sp. KNHs214]
MFFDPYFYNYNEFNRQTPFFSYVRILHASPDTPAVDIYLDNALIAKNLSYKNFTEYLSIPTGLHNLMVFPASNKKTPITNTNIFISEKKIFTAAVIGSLNNISIDLISEPIKEIPSNKTLVRFIHLSPSSPPVDITLPNGTKLFEDVEYKEVADYITVDPALYTLQARLSDTDKVILTVPKIHLKPNRFYSIYGIGLSNGNPPLQFLIPLDGNTYLKF